MLVAAIPWLDPATLGLTLGLVGSDCTLARKCIQAPRVLPVEAMVEAMVPPFDILRHEDGGTVLWVAVSNSMEEAEQIVAKAMLSEPAPYAIVSLKTGRQRVIEPDALP